MKIPQVRERGEWEVGKQMTLTILDKWDLHCVAMESRTRSNGESYRKADIGLGIKNKLSWKDE